MGNIMKTNAAHIIDFGTLASSQALYANSAKCEIDDVGTKCWRLNGKLHRTDGPAIQGADGGKSWYLNGKLHRTDGPAIEFANGSKWWYINGKEYTEEEFDTIKEVLWAI
jgi:hypothetical protein